MPNKTTSSERLFRLKPYLVKAIQWNGNNQEEIKAFILKYSAHVLECHYEGIYGNSLSREKIGAWFYSHPDGYIRVSYDSIFKKEFEEIKKNIDGTYPMSFKDINELPKLTVTKVDDNGEVVEISIQDE